MLRIRRAREDDWDDILVADRVCFPDDYPPEHDGEWWIAEHAGAVAAYAGCRPAATNPGHVYLCRAGVLPEWRGRRLQRLLVRVRERWARRERYAGVVTDTYRNPASANTLIACGYRLFEPAEPWSYASACYWTKNL